ncbi:protein pelota [Nematocida minor]|uniref:protein pelota n=1 Tax=Nematocida minor TaxID=1912983 RepID=UPI002220C74F|nr:protein pelota [Nematocida minor]KAI5190028.1 protein pelota [Nematocida minor]
MKIYKKDQTKYNVFLDLLPEDIDDIYELYRIIDSQDRVKTLTQRNISAESGKTKIRMSLVLEIEVENVTVDLSVGMLFIKGKILNETEYTKVGSFHTLEVCVNQRMSLKKDHLSSSSIKMLEEMTIENKATMAYLVCRKEGYSLVLTTDHTTKRIPLLEKSKQKEKVFKQILAHLKDSLTVFVILGGDRDAEEYFKKQKELKNKIVVIKKTVTSANTHKGDCAEIEHIYKTPDLLAKLKGLKKGNEIAALYNYFMLEDSYVSKTAVGMKETEWAAENFVVKTLIVVDCAIKSECPDTRKKIESIITLSKKSNAEIHIISQYTPNGDKIKDKGGIVAILTQPMEIQSML